MERTPSPLLHPHMVHQVQPKTRGRPRNSYGQAGEFDLGLIREYRDRPALYDRTHRRYKDKSHSASLWLQISHTLGYEVSILRDRMLSLRNRYNLEKRRIETTPSLPASAQWPLFEDLSFLSEHIRSRRPYKLQTKSMDGRHEDDDDEEPMEDMNSESNQDAIAIKTELDKEFGYDIERDQLPVTTVLSIPVSPGQTKRISYSAKLNNGHETVNGGDEHSPRQDLLIAQPKRIRLQPPAGEMKEPAVGRRRMDATTPSPRTNANSKASTIPTAGATSAESTSFAKFRAFGEFVSHSLNGLPPSLSMRLVSKFTRDLVEATLSHDRTPNNSGWGDQSSIEELDD